MNTRVFLECIRNVLNVGIKYMGYYVHFFIAHPIHLSGDVDSWGLS